MLVGVPTGGGGEGLARAQADLVRIRAGGGDVRPPRRVYAVGVFVFGISLFLPLVLVTLLK
jgi:hypothetical protein